jgi:hypothetical protein
MKARRIGTIGTVLATLLTTMTLMMAPAQSGEKKTDKKIEKKQEKKKEVWTDAGDPTLPADFKFQGEYAAENGGCQVIALGGGVFQGVFYQGGLPGKGWDTKNRMLMHGQLDGGIVNFVSIDPKEKRKYLAQSPLEFSATSKFPPVGHLTNITANIEKDILTIKIGGNRAEFKKVIRRSPTLLQKAPDGAILLYSGDDAKEWNGGRHDIGANFLNTDGKDVTTKRKFSSYTVHVEFMLPFRPDARGQGRGNSGFYQVDQYEVQILDSFGLEGKNNECGGVYTLLEPKVNMCLPPLQWQTYDIDFTNAVREGDKLVKKARLTCRHNGVLIHDDAELKGVTGGARALDKKRDEPEGTPGVLRLQGHGNPLQFRNIWIVEKK